MLAPMAIRSLKAGRGTPALFRAGGIAGILYGLHFGTWVTSLTLTSVASSVTLVTATPLLLGLHALFTGRDRPNMRHWLSIGLAIIGLAVIGNHDGGLGTDALLGDAFALAGAAAMAAYMLVSRALGDELDIWIFGGIATSVGGSALLITALVLGIPIEAASSEAFFYLFLAALIPQMVGHNLLTWVLQHTRPTIVGIATIGEPVGAAFLGWVW